MDNKQVEVRVRYKIDDKGQVKIADDGDRKLTLVYKQGPDGGWKAEVKESSTRSGTQKRVTG